MHHPGKVRRARYRTGWSGFPGIVLVALAAVGLFEGCTDPWKAPVESRSEARYRGAGIDGPVYRVKPGDTLYGIAWRAGVDYRDIARWNSVPAPYTIYVGQQLSVKGPARAASRKPTPPSASPKTSTEKAPKTSSPAKASGPSAVAGSSRTKTAARGDKGHTARRGTLRWRWPTDGRVTGTFSSRDPGRKGIKISGRRGQSVVAAEAGEVVYSGSGLVGYGELIIIKHNNDYLSAYGHNNKRLVKEGQAVKRGAEIAEMGIAAGRPTLHFEIRRRGKPVDPVALLPRR